LVIKWNFQFYSMDLKANYGSNLPGLVRLRLLDVAMVAGFSEPEYFKDLGTAEHSITSAAVVLNQELLDAGNNGWVDVWFLDGEKGYTEKLLPNGLWDTAVIVQPANDNAETRAWFEDIKKRRWIANVMDADGKARLVGTKDYPVVISEVDFTVSGYKSTRLALRCLSERRPYFCTAFFDNAIAAENSDFSEEFGFDFG
jgi:hypothetical protein